MSDLFADLREANELYKKDECGGVIASVEAVTRFLIGFPSVVAGGIHHPLLALLSALKSLDDGQTPNLLVPRKKRGRARESLLRNSFVGFVAYTADELFASGLKRDGAHEEIARKLREAGVRPSRKGAEANQGPPEITARTVRLWRGAVAEDVARESVAAQLYDAMMASSNPVLSALAPEHKRKVLLASLDRMLEWFPSPSQKST